ncbi:glycosyltransferase family 4 protein [Compostimonas suwonensis]|uniref:glycosyltransferase family 4 protein n=1 Tax=Compostimonas suwonensis TaxID=1048394 RepID=UPI001FEBB570|nr:glycosyltransferase family 4 protein [Compostimonas suwonensis]
MVATGDSLGAKMAGPAIRAWNIALAVSQVADVKLVSTARADLQADDFEVAFDDEDALRRDLEWCDVLVFQGHLLHHHPWIAETDVVIVADIYDPMHLETLEQGRYLSESDRSNFTLMTAEVLNSQIERADLLLCASEKQRDFWLGQMAALGRINPATYDHDSSLRSLLTVVPFGVSDEPPVQTRHALKGAIDGISEDDKVILWGGGIYNWFDPLTLIHAVHQLSLKNDNVRLFFLGMSHPNPDVPIMKMSVQARNLAEELGLVGRVVFFNEEWVEFDDRANYLLDADAGVSTHFDHLETSYSFRTRVLDYLWAGLPIVTTGGDTFEPIIRDEGLGRTVPPEDVDALVEALEDVLFGDDGPRYAANSARFAQELTWSKVLAPLVEFAVEPYRAPDLVRGLRTPRAEELADYKFRLDRVEGSASWRITAPLRSLLGAAKNLRKKIGGGTPTAG